jgi:uncharacterized protein
MNEIYLKKDKTCLCIDMLIYGQSELPFGLRMHKQKYNILNCTFLHVPTIGEKIEREMWQRGHLTHEQFIKVIDKKFWLDSITMTIKEIEKNNLNFIAKTLKSRDQWRLFGHGKVGYLDIETTSLYKECGYITTAVLHCISFTKIYVNGINLDELPSDINEFDVLVTYNGKCFDVPFIEHHYNTKIECIHLDLRYILSNIGYTGGLKSIETQLGFPQRDDDVDGCLAVSLWHKYKENNDMEALRSLIAYNFEDTVRLEYLMTFAYNINVERLSQFFEKIELPSMSKINPYTNCDIHNIQSNLVHHLHTG